MALIRCTECNRDISDQAVTCPGCGAPVSLQATTAKAPTEISYADGEFRATKSMMANLAASAIQACSYRVDSADEASGTVTFTTGMTMGSWTGVSGTIIYREVSPYLFEVTGAAKQNVQGGQVVALDLFSEARGKVDNVIREMTRQASGGKVSEVPANAQASTGCAVLILAVAIAPSAWFFGHFV